MHKSTAYDIEWKLTKMCSKKKKKERMQETIRQRQKKKRKGTDGC